MGKRRNFRQINRSQKRELETQENRLTDDLLRWNFGSFGCPGWTTTWKEKMRHGTNCVKDLIRSKSHHMSLVSRTFASTSTRPKAYDDLEIG